MTPAVALTIAGSDSSGGAGVQADLKAFAACGVFGTSAITAVTAQNTTGVSAVHVLPVDVVVAQVEAVLADLEVQAVKTGMLATTPVVLAVAELAAAGRLPRLVVDPVMVASSGARLLDPAAERAYVDALLPHAQVLTPNLHEAQVLLGATIRTVAEQREAARALVELGPRAVLVKGGHAVAGAGDDAVDVLCGGTQLLELRTPRVAGRNDHGTGCTLASAIAAALAQGAGVVDAVTAAKAYVARALAGSAGWRLGAGHGPLDHFGWCAAPTPSLPASAGRPS